MPDTVRSSGKQMLSQEKGQAAISSVYRLLAQTREYFTSAKGPEVCFSPRWLSPLTRQGGEDSCREGKLREHLENVCGVWGSRVDKAQGLSGDEIGVLALGWAGTTQVDGTIKEGFGGEDKTCHKGYPAWFAFQMHQPRLYTASITLQRLSELS